MTDKSGVSPQAVSHPGGGGGLRGLGESFQPDLSTGTGVYNVPLEFPKGPNQLTPNLSLSYSTGFGNGPFGVGWALNLPFIARKLERGVPVFDDERDTFLIVGEELIPIGGQEYSMRVEKEFTRFIRSNGHWHAIKRNGQRLVFGPSPDSRLEVVQGGRSLTYMWHLEEIIDPNGNTIHFTYLRDNGQLYLSEIQYAIYGLEFEYESRPDPFSSFRPGFEIRTALRCAAIRLRVQPLGPQAVRTWRLEYAEAPLSRLSLLSRITLSGFDPDTGASASLPPLELSYTDFDPQRRRYQRFVSQVGAPPPGLDDPNLELIDLEGRGLAGVLSLQNGLPRYWPNHGRLRWGPPRALQHIPAALSLADDRVRFADMDGNGAADLLVGRGPLSGYYENNGRGQWERFVHYASSPGLAFEEGDIHLVDINGDGLVDAVHAGRTGLYVYANRGQAGWEAPRLLPRDDSPAAPPDLSLDDPRVRLADMNGDGLLDVVLIASGRLEYWPSQGNGYYAASRVMLSPPRFPYPFDPARVFLIDINGSGLADVVYVAFDEVIYWINQSGNAFSQPHSIRATPPTSRLDGLRVADMNGTGTAGLLWAGPYADYRYLDFTGGVKPNLLERIDNHLGLVTRITYSTSTEQATLDREAGRPWDSYLPFPIQVVGEIVVEDQPAQTSNRVELAYHEGHFDADSRQFTGFGKVEQFEHGDASEPTTLTVSYFHNRIPAGASADQQDAFRSLRRMLYRTEVYGLDGSPEQGQPYYSDEIEWKAREAASGLSGEKIYFPAKKRVVHTVVERSSQSSRLTTDYEYDDAGNVIRETKLGEWLDDQMQPQQERSVTETSYAVSPATGTSAWRARERGVDGSGRLLKETRYYYDGAAFTGLPLGQATAGNLMRVEEVCLTQDLVQDVYGLGVADMTALGYHVEADTSGGTLFTRDILRLQVNSLGNPEQKLDVKGQLTRIEYDADHIYPIRFVDPRGFETRFTYQYPDGQVASYTDANGNVGVYHYDALGRLIAFQQAGDPADRPSLEYEYHTQSVPQFTVQKVRLNRDSPDSVKTVEYFDGHTRSLQKRAQAEGGRVAVGVQSVYNSKNHARGEYAHYFSTHFDFDPVEPGSLSVQSQTRRDALGREVEAIDFAGGRFVTRYGANQVAYFDAVHAPALDADPGATAPRVETIDVFNRVVAVREQNGSQVRTTRYEFDALDKLARGVDTLGGQLFRNTYDMIGRQVRVEQRESGIQVRLYDARNNMIEQRNAGGGVIRRAYDDIGRAIETRFGGPAGPLQERMVYDAGAGENLKGRLARVEGVFGTVEYSYHATGRVKRVTRTFAGLPGSFSIEYEANAADKVTRVVYPDGSAVPMTYGGGGLLESVGGVITGIDYGPTGKRELVTYANGLVTSYRYEPGLFWLRELRTTQTSSGLTYQHLAYSYDAVGNVTAIDDTANLTGKVRNNRRFAYDDLYQLVHAEGRDAQGNYQHDYRYDLLGNVLNKPDAFSQDFVYAEPGRPTWLSGLAGGAPNQYRHDDDGNLIHTPELDLAYDPWGRLVRATRSNGTVVEFVYDHDGHRTATHVTRDGVTESEHNFDNLYLIRGGERVKIVWDDIQKVAIIPDGQPGSVLHGDHLGNTNIVSSLADGGFVGQEEYYPFGGTAVSVSMPTQFRFNAKALDVDTGLYFFGGRYYSPALGRFITPDPYLRHSPERGMRKPISLHPYAFVMNNPVNIIDPNGLWFGLDDLIVAGIGFVGGVVGALINGADSWDEVLLSGLAGAAGAWLLWNLAPAVGISFSFLGSSSWVAGYMGAVTFGAAYAGLQILGTALTRALDQSDSPILGFFSFVVKFAMSPITTTLGLLAGLVRTGFGLWGDVQWFQHGVIVFQTDSGSPFGGAMTWGATVQWQGGGLSGARLNHELYHSRQFVYGGDGFGLTWATIGGMWGVAESWIDTGSPDFDCWTAASAGSSQIGNPLENRAHQIYSSMAC